jgi:hypothetical protein
VATHIMMHPRDAAAVIFAAPGEITKMTEA